MRTSHRSLNEIESSVSKACRGVGIPIGLDEEIGRAAKALCQIDAAHLGAFVDAMEAFDGGEASSFDPEAARRGNFEAKLASQRLSALMAGPAAVDVLRAGTAPAVILNDLDQPLVVVGVMLQVSQFSTDRFCLEASGGQRHHLATACQGGQLLTDPPGELQGDLRISVQAGLDDIKSPSPDYRGLEIDDAQWQRLTKLAKRLLVEASASSRLAGAGAGLLDND